MMSRFCVRLRIGGGNVEEVNKKLKREFIPVNAAERVKNEKVLLETKWMTSWFVNMPANVIMPAKWSCLPSDQYCEHACQCCRVHRLARHRGQSHDKQHRLGGRWETLYSLGYILDSMSFSSTFFGDLWLLRNVVSVIFLLLFAERFCSIYYHSFFGKVQSIKTKTSTQTQQLWREVGRNNIFQNPRTIFSDF